MPRNEVKKKVHSGCAATSSGLRINIVSINDFNDFVLSHSWTSSVTCWSPFRGLRWTGEIARNDSDLQESTPNHKSGFFSEGKNLAALRGCRYVYVYVAYII